MLKTRGRSKAPDAMDRARSPLARQPDVGKPASPQIAFREALRVWARIGCINFGGPAGQIALMHRLLVEEKRWIDEPRFLHALNYCMILPGPEAQQLATYVGWLMHGVRGGVAAGVLFVLPGFLVLVALSTAYVLVGELPAVQGILFGLKAAVLAIVAEALVRLARRALRTRSAVVLALAAFIAIAVFAAPFPLVVLASALLGMAAPHAWSVPVTTADPPLADANTSTPPARAAWAATGRSVAVWTAIWLAPVALLATVAGRDSIFTQLALFFSRVAIVTFGGAYAALAYVAHQAVDAQGWLRPDEMLTGLGLAETTPGPLILVLVFVGYLAAFREAGGLDPLVAGIAGACVTAWMIFAPSFLFIFAGAPFIERLRGARRLSGALAAVTAAVVGVIANLALCFGVHVLFGEVSDISLGPATLPIPHLASFDWRAAVIALGAALALLHWRFGVATVLAFAAAAGLLLRGLALP